MYAHQAENKRTRLENRTYTPCICFCSLAIHNSQYSTPHPCFMFLKTIKKAMVPQGADSPLLLVAAEVGRNHLNK
jgi:hypothetical protein